MTQACQTCNHKNVKNINKQIASGKSLSSLSKKYGISENSLTYHKKHHLTRQLAAGARVRSQNSGLDVLNELTTLIEKTEGILEIAESKGKQYLALTAIRELRGHFTLISNIQAFLMKMEAEKDKMPIEDYSAQERSERYAKEFQENITLNLSPLERKVYGELLMKIAIGSTEPIKGIIYQVEDIEVASHPTEEEKVENYTSSDGEFEEKEAIEEDEDALPTRAEPIQHIQLTYTDTKGKIRTRK